MGGPGPSLLAGLTIRRESRWPTLAGSGWHRRSWLWGGLDGLHPEGVFGSLLWLLLSSAIALPMAMGGIRLARRSLARTRRAVERPVRRGGLVASAGLALAHGSNDAQKTMGLMTAALVASGHLSHFAVPFWVAPPVQLTFGLLMPIWWAWGCARMGDAIEGVAHRVWYAVVKESCQACLCLVGLSLLISPPRAARSGPRAHPLDHFGQLLRSAHNQDRAVSVAHAVLAHRSQQHAGELAMAPAANDEEVRSVGGFDQ